MEKKGKRKINIQKRKSLKTLEFSITDRVSFLMKAREVVNKKSPLERSTRRGRCVEIGGMSDVKHTPTLSRHPSQEGNTKIIVRKGLDFNYSIPVRVVVRPDYLREFKKLFLGVSYYYSKMAPKVIAMFLIVALNWMALSSIGKTFAYYSDEEVSPDNYFGAANLNFDLYSQENFSPAVTPDVATKREIVVQNGGEMDMNYKANIEFKDESDILCSELDLKMKMNGLTIYNGKLSDFELHGLNMNSEDSDSFSFEVNLNSNDNKYWSKKCDFDLVFQGDQEDVRGFSDREVISNRVLSGVWEIPNDSEEGDVVINEIMWMGSERDDHSKLSGDEWIELRNTTDHDIRIGKWHIEELRDKGRTYMVPAHHIIPADGYFLLSSHPENSAHSDVAVPINQPNASLDYIDDYSKNGQIVLKDRKGNVIDETPILDNSDWPAGENKKGKKWSMERNMTPGSGLLLENWHTCDPSIMEDEDLITMHSYWNEDARLYNCGTPGHINLSKNDLSADDYEPVVLRSDNAENKIEDSIEDSIVSSNENLEENTAEESNDRDEQDKSVTGDSEEPGAEDSEDKHTPIAEVDATTPEHFLSPEVDSPSLEKVDSNDGVEVGDGENKEGKMDTEDNGNQSGDGEDEHTPLAEVGAPLEEGNLRDGVEVSDGENESSGNAIKKNNEEQGLDNEEESLGDDISDEESSEDQTGQEEKEQGVPDDEQNPAEIPDEVSPSQDEQLKPVTSNSEDKVGEAAVNVPEKPAEIINDDEEEI